MSVEQKVGSDSPNEVVYPSITWQMALVGWAMDRKIPWQLLPSEVRTTLDILYPPDGPLVIEEDLLKSRFARIFNVPILEIDRWVTNSLSNLVQAWKEDYEVYRCQRVDLGEAGLGQVPEFPEGIIDSGDDLFIYVQEIRGLGRLLTYQEEIALGKRLEISRLMKEAGFINTEDRVAREQLFQLNLRLVASNAHRFLRRGLDIKDLIQEGNIGLLRAVDKYDYRKGFRFSTYATWWIRQAMSRAAADYGRTIRIPVHMAETINGLKRLIIHLTQELGRDPTDEEIVLGLGQPVTKASLSKMRETKKAAAPIASLDAPIGDGEDVLGSLIPEKRDSLARVDDILGLREEIKRILSSSSLKPRERKILELRFGLDGFGRSRTLEEVGKEFGLTRERIRQIEGKAIRKLRHPTYLKRLKPYID